MSESEARSEIVLDLAEAGKKSGVTSQKPALRQLGDYRIIREIGHGGMGVVYEAEQVSLGRPVALKVLPDKALLDPKHKRRFEREARAAAKLHHTNIVPVFGVGDHDGLPYYVMQLIQGLGLDAVLEELQHMQPMAAHTPSGLPTAGEIRVARRDLSAAEVARSLMTGEFQPSASDAPGTVANPRPDPGATVAEPARGGAEVEGPAPGASSSSSATDRLSDSFTASSSSVTLARAAGSGPGAARKQSYWQSMANIGRQAADALAHAHKQGVLHRDIKPSNLLLDLRGTVWVTDFGLAKLSGPGSESEDLTHTGDILGTLRYMPPEAFDGRSDARSDIYALGLTLYEMVALRPAYDEQDRHRLIRQVTTGEPAALDKVNPKIPRDLVTIIHKAIDREPSRRYATAEDLASDLQRFLDDEPIQARRQTQLERYVRWARHNPGIALLGGVLTAVLVLATLASLLVAGRMATLADQARQNEERALRNEEEARQNAQRAEQSEKETGNALATVAAQKAEVEDSLSSSLEYFSAALQQADGYDARKPIVMLAARFDMVLGALLERQPEDPQLQLALARRLTERGQKLLARKRPAMALDELEKAHAIFQRLLAPGDGWKVIAPVESKAISGTKLELQKDGSIFVHSHPAADDTYTLVFRSDLKGITGVRLEALSDFRLPRGGPGWSPDGDFVLNELALHAAPADSPDKANRIALRNASADFTQVDMDVRDAVDGIIRRGWGIWPEVNKDHAAVFDLARKVGDGGTWCLTVRLKHVSHVANWPYKLGRFRLSFTNDARTLQATRVRWELKDSKLLDCYLGLGKAYAQQGRTNEALASFTEALPLDVDRAGKARIVAEAGAVEGALAKLARRAAGDGQLQAELARHYAERGHAPLADAAHTKARALFEEKLAKEPESSALAAELAQVLLDRQEQQNAIRWTVLEPTEMTSKGGATLLKLPDASILASGTNSLGDAYTIVAQPKVARVSVIRLEALTHESLPNGGPGRDERKDRGNFDMQGFTIRAHGPGSQPRPVEVSRVAADYFIMDLTANHWNIGGGGGSRPHMAVYLARQPVACKDDARLELQMQFSSDADWPLQNLGRFRLSVSSDPAAFNRDAKRFVAMKLTDPWAKLAAAYYITGDQQAFDKLLARHPTAAAGFGDLYAANQDWERAKAAYRKLITEQPADGALLTKIAAAYQSAGRTREGIPYLAKASAANPKDTILAVKVAALQAWFGQEKELAATRQRLLAFARYTNEGWIADSTAKACSILPSTDKGEIDAALTLGRTGVQLKKNEWSLLALGMAEYRSGNDAAADEALLAAAQAVKSPEYVAWVKGTAGFYRAMSLYRRGNKEEGRKVAVEAAATMKTMKPLPADEQNPPTSHDDLILWLAYKEAKATIHFDEAPPPAD